MTYQSLEASVSNPVFQYASMSDLEEAERWAQTHDRLVGLGEEAYDSDAVDALKLFGPGNGTD